MHSTTVTALLGASYALANPVQDVPNTVHTRANDTSCIFTGPEGYLDVLAAKTSCSDIVLSNLQVPGNVTLNLEGLNDGTTVTFEGRTTWDFYEWFGPLFSVSGNYITVTGAPGSVLDGQGSLWWDGLGNGGGRTKPKFFKANHLNNSLLDSIYILNAPLNSFSINYIEGLLLRDIIVNNTAAEAKVSQGNCGLAGCAVGETLGHNTDAFDINNSNKVVITNATVWNQDDCVAINSGTNVVFEKSYCSGGHGLSLGSVGGRDNNLVQNILFDTVEMVDSEQSVRIKTVSGKNGTVDRITYRNIKISGGTDYGIVVNQSYNGIDGQPTNGVSITNFVLENVTGTVLSDAVNVLIECGVGSCRDWSWTDVSVTGGQTSTSCMNVPDGISC